MATVLVTGATGFVGHRLMPELIEQATYAEAVRQAVSESSTKEKR